MDKYKKQNKDPLREYFDIEGIEKAPEGFTLKTMTRVRLEAGSVQFRRRILTGNRIPVISLVVTTILVTLAILVPSGQSDSVFASILKNLGQIRLTMPDLKILSANAVNFPLWAVYGLVCLFLIVIIDRALSGIFHKAGK
jgi:hypothetical protein